ncbi:phage tail spike protein [Propionimicrobium lymphophilum]|uniref:phage tail spike protein n=1 Tax=Propionimicrobium lymphophilum TaxID=33012 RepID=UPI00254F98C2|nr:phage tail spike protein [Propionimicrobium lymphophilum]MDK7709166.1 phage tail spike protein [Propionimicrobium lymphophilum]MDK7733154.1 phage tail spike protein [Propionimicrobium lymphophilum]
MISVHNRAAQTFTATGLAVLDCEIIDPVVIEELNGKFVLSFSYPADGPAAQHLVLENIVACRVPGMQVRQGFRISEVATTLDGLFEVTAHHVFYDLAANLVADTFVVNKTAVDALKQLLNAANSRHGFTASSSDTNTHASARIVRQPLAAAILDTKADNSFVSRWGGELAFDNWHIHHAPRRGRDAGVVIRDRKNLTGYESALDYTTVITRILPVGYDGLLLPELYVDSPRIGDYVAPRIKVIRYGSVKAIKDPDKPREDELPLEQAHTKLRELAKAEFSSRHVDQPACSYKVSFIDLASTREYEGLRDLETVALGDSVTVRHDDLNIALTARVVAYDYDPLVGEYISVELGSTAAKFTDITHTINTARAEAAEAGQLAGVALASAEGKTTNHYGAVQPALARLGDTWFRDNGEKTEIWIYATTSTGEPGWVAVATDLNQARLSCDLDAMRTEVLQAVGMAETAAKQAATISGKVDSAVSDAAMAKHNADEATSAVAANGQELEAYKLTVTSNLDGVSSQLTQLAGDIDLRVTRSGVISQINVSPETILIAGNRIHLSGQTTIDDGVIKTAMIADLAVTSAKIAYLSADKITTGTLAAARIAAGSITSDKLTIANGFIQTAMIADAAVTNAKIANLDAAKITTGYLNAARIQAGSVSADKLAANAIQVGLAGWDQSIRIDPNRIEWFESQTRQGSLSGRGMQFWYGSRFIGEMTRGSKAGNPDVQGIGLSLGQGGDYVAWSYQNQQNGNFSSCLTLDPKGKFYGTPGIHLGADLRTRGHKFYTSGDRFVSLQDVSLTDRGTHPGWVGQTGLSKIVFHTYDLMVVTNGSFYNMSRVIDRLNDLMNRVNKLLDLLNKGWVTRIERRGSDITWGHFSSTGYNRMSTNLT